MIQYPNVKRFWATIVNQEAAVKIYGSAPSLIAKPKEYTPPAKEPKAAKAPAAAPAPKAEKPKKAAAKEDDDDEEPAAAQEPKAKHPCEALGKAELNLEDWKRKYSNEDTPVAVKWLDENLKPNEYSFWKVTYKYPEELTKKGQLLHTLRAYLPADVLTGSLHVVELDWRLPQPSGGLKKIHVRLSVRVRRG